MAGQPMTSAGDGGQGGAAGVSEGPCRGDSLRDNWRACAAELEPNTAFLVEAGGAG